MASEWKSLRSCLWSEQASNLVATSSLVLEQIGLQQTDRWQSVEVLVPWVGREEFSCQVVFGEEVNSSWRLSSEDIDLHPVETLST